jgi:hypothetical protein
LPKKSVEVLDVCFDKNPNKPSNILNQIRDQLAPQLSKKQLNNYKYRNNRKHLGHSSATLQEIIQWCEEKSEVREDPDEVFCGGFEYKGHKPKIFVFFPGHKYTIWAPIMIAHTICR